MLPLNWRAWRQSASLVDAVLWQLCRVVPPSLPQFRVSRPAYPKRHSVEAAQGRCCTLTVHFTPDSMAALADCFQVGIPYSALFSCKQVYIRSVRIEPSVHPLHS